MFTQKPERNSRSHPVFRNFILHDKQLKINNKTKKISLCFWLCKESANPRVKRKISIYKNFRMCYYVCGEDWALTRLMPCISFLTGCRLVKKYIRMDLGKNTLFRP